TMANVRMEVFSKPEPIEKLDRVVAERHIEIHALEGETDRVSKDRLVAAKAELKKAQEESAAATAVWQKEKKAVVEVKKAKEDLEAAKLELEQKMRDKDWARVGQLQNEVIPDREKTLKEFEGVDLSKAQYLQTEVREADVAKTISKMT